MARRLTVAAITVLALQTPGLAAEDEKGSGPAFKLDWKLQEVQGEQRLEAQDWPGAEACFRSGLKDCKAEGGTPDQVVSCMQNLAGVLQKDDLTHEAFALYKKALHIMERIHGKDNPKILPSLLLVADVRMSEGDYAQAVKLYTQAVDIASKDPGVASLAYADYQYRLGKAFFAHDDVREAEEHYRIALSGIMHQTQLPSSDLLNEVLSDYIDLINKSSDKGKALSSDFQNELLKDQVGTLGQRTSGVGTSMWAREVSAKVAGAGAAAPVGSGSPDSWNQSAAANPTRSSAGAGSIQPDRSIPDFVALEQMNQQRIDFYERMIESDVKTLGPEHPSVARDLTGLATVYLVQKKYSQAQPLLDRALKIYSNIYGNDGLLVKRIQSLLNLIADEQSRPSEAFVDNDALRNLPPVPLEAQKLELALKLNYLAFLCYSHGKLDEASTIYAWALADTTLSFGEQSTMVASCLTDYSHVLRSTGKSAEAEKMESKAQIILRHALARQAAASLP